MTPKSRHTTLALALTAALVAPAAVATTAGATPAGAEEGPAPEGTAYRGHLPRDEDQAALSRAVADAATEAAQRRRSGDGATVTGVPGPRADAALDDALQGLVDDGAVAVTARVDTPDGRWRGAEGVRQRGRTAPAHPQDRFRVASITKPMIATLVMQEVEQGTWTLDTTVKEILPGVFPEHPEVTIGQLLSHRSGAPTATDMLLFLRMKDPTSVDELFRVMGLDYSYTDHLAAANAAPWVLEPGTGFSYSNAGYVVLGMMLEEVTGDDVERLLRDRVFKPARMVHSAYPDESRVLGTFLVGSAYTGDAGDGWYSLRHFDPDVFSAAGAVTSTTADLNSFTEALLTGDLVDPALVQEMITPRSADPIQYGLGVYRVPDPCSSPQDPEWLYGHDGGAYGTVSLALSSPDGERQLSLGVTGRNLSEDEDALYDVNDVLVPMLLATC